MPNRTKTEKALIAATGYPVVDLTRGHHRSHRYRIRSVGKDKFVWEKHGQS